MNPAFTNTPPQCSPQQQTQSYLIQGEFAVSQWGQRDLMRADQTKVTGATGDERRSSSWRSKNKNMTNVQHLELEVYHQPPL